MSEFFPPTPPQPVFIVSTGRAGSTLMSNIINTHPDILSISEMWMSLANRAFVFKELDGAQFWSLLSKPSRAQAKVFRPDSMAEYIYDHNRPEALPVGKVPPIMAIVLPHLTAKPEALLAKLEAPLRALPRAPLRTQYDALFGLLMAKFKKSRWVERTGASVIFTPALRRLYPDAKFIHLTRDGRETAYSMAQHGPIRMFMKSWKRLGRIGVDMLRPPTLLGDSKLMFWVENLGMALINPDKAMAEPVTMDLAGQFWSEMVAAGLEGLDGLGGDQLLTLAYEDLVQSPRQTLAAMMAFIDPALAHANWLDSAAAMPRRSDPKWHQLDADQQALLGEACAPGSALLDYSR